MRKRLYAIEEECLGWGGGITDRQVPCVIPPGNDIPRGCIPLARHPVILPESFPHSQAFSKSFFKEHRRDSTYGSQRPRDVTEGMVSRGSMTNPSERKGGFIMFRNRGKIGLLVAALCLGFLVLPISAQATDNYVDDDVSNGNCGTGPGDAWKTIT